MVERKLVPIIVAFAAETVFGEWRSYFEDVRGLNLPLSIALIECSIAEFTMSSFDHGSIARKQEVYAQIHAKWIPFVVEYLANAYHHCAEGTSSPSESTYRGSPASHEIYPLSPASSHSSYKQLKSPIENQLAFAVNSYTALELKTAMQTSLQIVLRLFELDLFYQSTEINQVIKLLFDYSALIDSEFGVMALSAIAEFMSHAQLNLETSYTASDRLMELISINSTVKESEQEYSLKLCYVISVFSSNQLARMIILDANIFPVANFLAILSRYTINQRDDESLCILIKCWKDLSIIIDAAEYIYFNQDTGKFIFRL